MERLRRWGLNRMGIVGRRAKESWRRLSSLCVVGLVALVLSPSLPETALAGIDPVLADIQDGGVGNSLGFSTVVIDLDQDGVNDVIVGGCPYDDGPNNDVCNSGCVTVFDYSSPSAKRVDVFPSPAEEGDMFGAVMATGGDIDGDGIVDLLVSAPLANPGGVGNAGRVFVVSGAHLLYPNDPNFVTILAVIEPPTGEAQVNGQFGGSLAVIGDVTNDNRADFAIGAPNYSPTGKTHAGKTYVYAGAPHPQNPQKITSREGSTANDNFGAAVAGIGNLGTANPYDPTGTPDLVVGSPGWSASGGSHNGDVFAYAIDPNGVTEAAKMPLIYQASVQLGTPVAPSGSYFGSAIAGGGSAGRVIDDPNNDPTGTPDFVVGAPIANNGAGTVWLVFNTRNPAPGVPAVRTTQLTMPTPPAGVTIQDFGRSVAFLDRVAPPLTQNGMQISDVVVGAPNSLWPSVDPNTFGPYPAVGIAYRYNLSTGAVLLIQNPQVAPYDEFGASLATSTYSVGGQLRRKVHVGAPYDNVSADPTPPPGGDRDYVDVGSVHTFDLSSPTPTRVNGVASGIEFGYCVAGQIDVNGDGVDDLLVGAPGTDAPTNGTGFPFVNPQSAKQGAVFAYSGAADTPLLGVVRPTGYNDAGVDGAAIDQKKFGFALAVLRNPGLGVDQFIATAPYEDFAPRADVGRAWIYAINPLPPPSPASFVFAPEAYMEGPPGDLGNAGLFGFAVTDLPDVTRRSTPLQPDGIVDFAVSAPGVSPNPSGNPPSHGVVYVYGGLLADGDGYITYLQPAYAINGLPAEPYEGFGNALAALSVPNPTGGVIHYLLVGAPLTQNVNPQDGRVYIFQLNATGYVFSGLLAGERGGDQFGTSIAATIDVNGDGYPDFLVGAPYFDRDPLDPAMRDTGRVYCYSGDPSTINYPPLFGVIDPPLSDSSVLYALTASDLFGQSIAGRLGGGAGAVPPQIVVGAPGADVAGQGNRGAAFAFGVINNMGTVTFPFLVTLTNDDDLDHGPGDRFGVSVSNGGPILGFGSDVVLVGAPWVDSLSSGRPIRRKGTSYAIGFNFDMPESIQVAGE
ncbi:MAG: FG-GAP repeat protein [Planctomycetes bacterium]|nr:FG-GAP repeat protein [Planctomycetota bacterium]MBI3843557.1 FG-GAP repeat protein [Planctomycetota bacterium]